jgi:tetratricopeptide (TPR) repeat protein
LDDAGRNAVRTLAVSLHDLGQIRREQGSAECVEAYQESLDLSERIGEQAGAAICAFNLGRAYVDLPALRDLERAERWYQHSLDLYDEGDRLGRAKYYSQLGLVAYERFGEARDAGEGEEALLEHLNDAARFHHRALDLTPPDVIGDLAVDHNQLGNIYGDAGDVARALGHWREAIRYKEAAGNAYGAATTRYNVAVALARAGRLADARAYAEAARRGFETYGSRAVDMIQMTQRLIDLIEQAMGEGR